MQIQIRNTKNANYKKYTKNCCIDLHSTKAVADQKTAVTPSQGGLWGDCMAII